MKMTKKEVQKSYVSPVSETMCFALESILCSSVVFLTKDNVEAFDVVEDIAGWDSVTF